MFTTSKLICAPEGTQVSVGAPLSSAQPSASRATVRPKTRLVTVKMSGAKHDLAIPYVLTELTNGDAILRYCVDTKDALAQAAQSPVQQGAASVVGEAVQPALRAGFIETRGAEPKTQLEYAQEGIITPEMEYVALRESAANLEFFAPASDSVAAAAHDSHMDGKFQDSVEQGLCTYDREAGVITLNAAKMAVTPELVRAEIAAGRAVLPANHHHPESEPMIIGKRFLTKVNANIGASAVSSDFSEEIGKLKLALRFGADTVMDLSTGLDDLAGLRSAIIRASAVPIGTVPVYEALDRVHGDASALTWEVFRQVIIDQAQQGVDYFTIHAGFTKDLLPAAAARLMGVVSRGGAIMASNMMLNDSENLAYAHFDELMAICRKYDVALSLGDGLRPGAVYDACDAAQYGELKNIGMLAARCKEHGVQCFIEGPGHVPLDRVEENQRLEDEYCHEAPFYTLGPLVSDVGAGFDHITSAIGGTNIAAYGTSMLCYVTPSEHLALPTPEDVKQGLICYKLAAHAADLAKHVPQAINIDHAMSRARATFRWLDQFVLSFDEAHAYEVWRAQMDEENCNHSAAYCSMCGPRFCPIRLNRRLQAKYAK